MSNDLLIDRSGQAPADEPESEIIVIGRRLQLSSPISHAGGAGGGLSIIARSGGTNHPDAFEFIEDLRALFVTQTDYDLDTRFTAKQKEIILKALQGLADHPVYGPAMATLAAKGADINIIADFFGRNTYGDRGRIDGRNDDGTIDQGESITIYIDMNFGGAPITNASFAEVIVHELIHSLGVPAFDAALDAHGSRVEREVRNEIFSGYDFYAPPEVTSLETGIIDAPDTGGALVGTAAYEVFSGSEFADVIAPGGGGSRVYSGGGDDRISLVLDGGVDEIFDSAGLDTIELPTGISPSSVSLRWVAGTHDLAVLVNGSLEAIIVDADGRGTVERISIGGVDYALSDFHVTTNRAPGAATINATVYNSFSGGGIANGTVADADGDTLSYRIETISGDYADENWTIDAATGAIFVDCTWFAEQGNKYTFLTLIVSDGLETSSVSVEVRWVNPRELDRPIEGAFESGAEPPGVDAIFPSYHSELPPLEAAAFHG